MRDRTRTGPANYTESPPAAAPARRGRDEDFALSRDTRGTRVRVQHPVFSRLPSSLHTVPWLKLHARPLHEAHERPRTNLRLRGVQPDRTPVPQPRSAGRVARARTR